MLPIIINFETLVLEYEGIIEWVDANPSIMATAVYQGLEKVASGETESISLIEVCVAGKAYFAIELDPADSEGPALQNEDYWVRQEDWVHAARVRDIREYIKKK